MNKHPELATAMLAIAFFTLLVVTGYLYVEHRTTRETLATPQAGVKEGSDIRRVSEASPYMRSERYEQLPTRQRQVWSRE